MNKTNGLVKIPMIQFMQQILFCWEYKGSLVQSSQTECDLKIEFSVLRNGKDGVKGLADWKFCTLYFGRGLHILG